MTYQDQLRRVGLCLVDPRTVETLWSNLEPIGTDDLRMLAASSLYDSSLIARLP
jgi:hypothetical protein